MRNLIATSAALLLSLPAASQTPSDGTIFNPKSAPAIASGGSGSNLPTGACHQQNMTCNDTIGNSSNKNVFALPFTANGQAITQMVIRTTSGAAGGIRSVELWSADTAGKPIAAIRKATVKCAGPKKNYATASFPAVGTKAGQKFCLVTDLVSGAVDLPACAPTTGTKTIHYWHPPSATAWNGPFTTVPWSFAINCCATTKCAPSSYTLSGKGCPGSPKGPGGCHSQNLTCTGHFGNNGNTNVFATPFTMKTAAVADGCILRTAGAGTFMIQIWTADAAGKPLANIGAGTMKTQAPFANYPGKFAKPIILKPGNYCLVRGLTSGSGGISGCNVGTKTIHYWYPPAGGPPPAQPWRGPFTSLPWSFAITCIGGGGGAPITPEIGHSGLPTINKSFTVTLSKAAPQTGATLLVGTSKTVWGPLNLPLNLGFLGAPLCDVLASGEITLATATSSTGTGSVKIPLPNNSYLIGKDFHNQWFIIDIKANKLGLATTRLGSGLIGN